MRFITLAKDSENLLQPDYVNCKKAFINCSKLQDKAIEYMVGCYTSITGVKTNMKKLVLVVDAATKLKTNQESLVLLNSRFRVARGLSLTCAEYNKKINTLQTVSHFFLIMIFRFCLKPLEYISLSLHVASLDVSKWRLNTEQRRNRISDQRHPEGECGELQSTGSHIY